MRLLKILFGASPSEEKGPGDPLVPVPVPALVVLLLAREREKGTPLTETEVLEVRDNCVCMMLPLSMKIANETERGYRDIDPEDCWQAWRAFREQAQD